MVGINVIRGFKFKPDTYMGDTMVITEDFSICRSFSCSFYYQVFHTKSWLIIGPERSLKEALILCGQMQSVPVDWSFNKKSVFLEEMPEEVAQKIKGFCGKNLKESSLKPDFARVPGQSIYRD